MTTLVTSCLGYIKSDNALTSEFGVNTPVTSNMMVDTFL